MKSYYLLIALVLAPCISWADTVSVVGVVVREVGDLRVPGERVGVYTTKEADVRGKLGADETSKRGVYSIVVKNVSAEVKKLWVVYEGKGAVAEAQEIDLAGARDDVRQAKAEDLRLLDLPKTGETITPERAGKLVAAQASSNTVKVNAGTITDDASLNQLTAFVQTLHRPLVVEPGTERAVHVAVAEAAVKEVERKPPTAVSRSVTTAVRRLFR